MQDYSRREFRNERLLPYVPLWIGVFAVSGARHACGGRPVFVRMPEIKLQYRAVGAHGARAKGNIAMPMQVSVEEAGLPGVLVVKAGIARDDRGYFSEIYSKKTFAEAGIDADFVQDNLSLSAEGIFRGLHYQLEPYAMGKLVRAIRGAVYDVVVDLRRGSPTFGLWKGVTLTEENHLALWVPPGFAHGFLTLENNTLFHYKCTQIHTPEAERSIRYDDPALGIQLPVAPKLLSPKDAQAPLLKNAEFNFQYT